MTNKTYQGWVVVERSADVPGQWMAHCLNFDVVSQGNSLGHAVHMILEAVSMVLEDDLEANRDPTDRWAPRCYWDDFWACMKKTETVESLDEVLADEANVVKLMFQLEYHHEVRDQQASEVEEEAQPLLFWRAQSSNEASSEAPC